MIQLNYCKSLIKEAVKVNDEIIYSISTVEREIVSKSTELKWLYKLLKNLIADLKRRIPGVESLSPTNILYMKNFYFPYYAIAPPIEKQFDESKE